MATLLLNHFNGSDGATSFTDEVAGVTWSRGGDANAELDTAQKQFGTASLLLPGTGDSWAEGSGFSSPHAGNWCAEVFGRASAGGGANFELRLLLLDASDNEAATLFVAEGSDEWFFTVYNSSGTAIVNQSGSVTFAEDTFYHFAIQRDDGAGTWAAYFNGNRLVSVSAADCRSFTKLRLYQEDSVAAHFDEVRLTSDLVYSGASYTIPTAEFGGFSPSNFERTWELQPVDIIPIGVQSAEFGTEIYHVVRYQVTVQSAEFDREKTSLYASKNLNAQSAEFGREIMSLPPSVVPAGSEYIWEARSASIITACPVSFERDFEITSGELPGSLTVNPQSAEFTYELQPIDIIPVSAHAPEFDREFKSVSVGYLGVTTGEWDREFKSLAVSLNLVVTRAEFGWEAESGDSAVESSIQVFSAEFDREHRSLALANNVVVTNYEKGYELRPVDIIPVSPAASEYGREIANAILVQNAVTPLSAEFGREVLSVFLSESSNPTVRPKDAEFGYEFQPITNIIPVNAEFDTEIQSAYIEERSGLVQSPEFDWECSSVGITLSIAAQPDSEEFGHEIQSAQVSINLPVVSVEFDREFGSAQISSVVYPESGEWDYEAGTVDLIYSRQNEYDYEAGSVGLLQAHSLGVDSSEFDYEVASVSLPGQSGIDVTGPESGWEAGKTRLRYFHRRARTPRDRVKIVHQI